ncbi:MAG: TetR/AcrR family transcriptional regulator [Candidatus Wallbacteria bacterium]|nr:TetR/AcrR family transcriptional regulator [Candidatus Wallbacteria bacterium]
MTSARPPRGEAAGRGQAGVRRRVAPAPKVTRTASTELPVPRRVKRSEARRADILKAAARAFRRHGYHEASLDQIAEELMLSKGSVYYYFESKEAILFALHDHSLDAAQALLDRVRASVESPSAQLSAIIEGHLEIIFDELQASGIVLDFSALSADFRERVVEKRDRFERSLRQIVTDGVKRGEFVPCDSTVVTFAILGAINWVARWYSPGGRLTPKAVARQYADFLVRGLVCERRGAFCPLGFKEGKNC